MIRPASALLAAALLFGPILAVELGVRLLIDSGRLPLAPSSATMTDASLANLERLGRPDVLVIGTSSIRNALQPDVLEELVEQSSGQRIRVQSVAQGSLSLKAQRLMIEGLAGRGLLPDTVIVGLSPTSVTGSEEDGSWFMGSELGRLWSGCADLDGPPALECRLGQASALWRWRGQPGRIIDAIAEGSPATLDERDRVLHENGWTGDPPVNRQRLLEMLPGTLERLAVGIDTPDWVVADYVALMDTVRSHGADAIAFTLPYAAPLEEALLGRNPAWREQLEAGYATFEAATGVAATEVRAFGDWWAPRSQNDLRHLSREGAGPFTRQLWDLPAFRAGILGSLASAD